MSKRRYNDKKIAQTPSLKKKLAKFVAAYDVDRAKYNLTDMLAYGHRGYISYSEDELCRAFDKIYESMLEKVEAMKKDIQEMPKRSRSWEIEDAHRRLQGYIDEMSDANEIANEIFEERFLK